MKSVDYLVHVHLLPQDLALAIQDKNNLNYDTAQLYSTLVASNQLWRVWSIDTYGQLWLELNFINNSGEAEFHTLKLDPGTYTKIDYENYQVLES